jgi:tetratricopeptide (TPR) repeat protein
MPMRIISFNDFINLVFCKKNKKNKKDKKDKEDKEDKESKESKENKENSTRFCFVLGSGASKACGIPTGLELAARWAEEIHELRPEYLPSIKKNLHNKKNGLDPKQSENYFNLYYARFYAQPSEGPKYLEKVMQDAELSCGFYTLAQLLMDPRHNLVLTTNFDSMVEDSLSIYAKSSALVIPHESLAHYIDITQKKPMVVKLHRSLFFDPKNTNDDMDKLVKDWTPALDKIFSIYTPLVIGYNGGDLSLMQYMLDKADTLRGLYWFKRKCDKLPDCVKQLLDKCSGHLIEIDEPNAFDWIMWKIGECKDYPDATKWLSTRAGDLSERYNAQVAAFSENAKDTTVKEDIKQYWRNLIEDRTRRIEENPKDAKAFFDRAYAYGALEEHEQAIADYTKAIELNPDAVAYHNRAYSYNKLKQHEQAIADCTKAIELDPKDAVAYHNLGCTYNRLEQYNKALENFTTAIRMNPAFPDSYYFRAKAYDALGQPELAAADRVKSKELTGEDAT